MFAACKKNIVGDAAIKAYDILVLCQLSTCSSSLLFDKKKCNIWNLGLKKKAINYKNEASQKFNY